MFEGIAESFYKLHYNQAISPYLTDEQKRAIAGRISKLTLQSPIWLNSEADYIKDFPELRPYVNTKLSGLYLCVVMAAIVMGQ